MATLTVNQADLQYILKQIEIAEAHSAFLAANPGATLEEQSAFLRTLVESPLLPEGLRTVNGSLNSLVPGQELYGSADQLMQRLLDPVFNTAESLTSYLQTSGFVFDSQPRTISNLIVDQSLNNPAAIIAALEATGASNADATASAIVAAYNALKAAAAANDTEAASTAQAQLDTLLSTAGLSVENGTVVIPNISADAGLTAPFNSWMTLFGQFFDHGLDLVNKGGSGTVYIPLMPDDPLYVPGSPTNFMVLTRATNQPGPDGVVGTADDIHQHTNQTTPYIDQNQTYTSNASHQAFLREYVLIDGKPMATGHMLDGQNGGLATWAEIKLQAREVLGIELADYDVTNVPMLLMDPYGEFIRGDNGYPQLYVRITPTAENPLGIAIVEGNPDAPVSTVLAVRTGHAFLDDIAHTAKPVLNPDGSLAADGDAVA
ncbi:MAG: peroxidase family protein, partial [Pseudomonas sp.]